MEQSEQEKTLEICREVYKKTLAYDLMGVRVNEDGSLTKLHSDRYMDEHPDANREMGEFWSKEEIMYMYKMVKHLLIKEQKRQ